MQLGSLYPFARNHNHIESISQEPYAFGPTLLKTSYMSLKFRYSILKYYYSLFMEKNSVGMVIQPLFFEFGKDKECFSEKVLNEQFLIGRNLLISPVLEPNSTGVYMYLPGKSVFWYEIHSGRKYDGYRHLYVINEKNATAPIFIRGGSIIFRQKSSNVLSTKDLDNKFYFSIALDQANQARGKFPTLENYNDESKVLLYMKSEAFIEIFVKKKKIFLFSFYTVF